MELLLTFVGIIVAIYAIAPRFRKLELALKLNRIDWVIIIVGLLFILCLEFYDFIEGITGEIIPWSWPTGLTPGKLINLIIVLLILFVSLRIFFFGLSRGKIVKFQKLIEELTLGKHFVETHSLLEKHSRFIFDTLDLEKYSGAEKSSALEIVRLGFLTPNSVKALAADRPYTAVKILKEWKAGFARSDFFVLYLKSLLSNRQSVFYSELQNNFNLTGSCRYQIPESNRLLFYLFKDAKIAHELCPYKPVGDFVLKKLSLLARNRKTDPYNQPFDYDENEKDRLSITVALHFFEIMVSEALYQGIEWHMWLYYYPSFVRAILRNYDSSNPLVDQTAEWPIRYSFILYKIFSGLRGWIRALSDLPPIQQNVILVTTEPTHENNNIPKSSILALGDCVSMILETRKLDSRFKRYLMDIVFEIFFKLKEMGRDDYATAFEKSLINGGFYFKRNDSGYRDCLKTTYSELKREYYIKYNAQWVTDFQRALES